MFKFLRKYNKLLLAIFGVLLMITFLIPQAMNQFARQSGQRRAVVATVGNDQKVTEEDWDIAQRELHLAQRFGINLLGLGSIQKMPPEQWYLLVREASAAGVVPNGGSIDIPEENLIQIANATGERDPMFIRNALARIRGVNEMLMLYETSGMYSDRRLKHVAESELYEAVAQLVVLKADESADVAPTDAQIAEQFAKYADVIPGQGEDGFGYKLPDRVKLEWLHIPADAVRENVRQGDAFSPVAQRVHWLKYQDDKSKNFPKSEGGPIPDVVSKDLLDQLTNDKLDQIARYGFDQFRLNRRGIPEHDGYLDLPPDWDQHKLQFPQLAASIQNEFGIAIPEYQSAGKWIAVNELHSLPGIGSASTDKFGTTPMPLETLVANSRELHQGAVSVYIQKDVAAPPIRGENGDIYLFRILDVQKSHKPDSVDEVRDQVIADLKRVADYKRLADSSQAIEQDAETKGMLSFAMEHNTIVQPTTTLALYNRFKLMQEAQNGQPLSNSATNLPVLGTDKDVIRKALDYAMSLPVGESVDKMSEDQRVFVVPAPKQLSLAVFRLMQRTPLSQEEYSYMLQMGAIRTLAASKESNGGDTMNDAFGVEVLVKRNNFAFSRSNNTEPTDEPPAESTAKAS